ncbi:GNAT family N-acetyltransferase [Bacillus thuringiensis serovar yunnanensis]|nr:GNAT family N-acetyltransferase [Bacillus thuringiensis serovar yunnanensis]
MIVREALPEETHELSQLALSAKATWGYSEEFILACKESLTITEEYIQNNYVYILEHLNVKIGFFAFKRTKIDTLDWLYIHPKYKGKGYGRILWQSLVVKAVELGIMDFMIVSEPKAEGFYIKMGAKRTGETFSTTFKDRILPILHYDVPN